MAGAAAGGVVARRVLVSGRVQGVWYRDSCRREALDLGVTGWARNTEDGDVEVHAEGPAAAVASLVAWCGVGPPDARVVHVAQRPVPPEGHARFTIR